MLKLTSGTSGEPGPFALPPHNCWPIATTSATRWACRRTIRNYGVISFAHSYGFSNLITPLLCRGVALVASREMMPRAVADGLAASGATVFPAVPAVFRALGGFRFDSNSVRLCVSAGAPLSAEVAGQFYETWGRKVHSFYRASECEGYLLRCERRSGRPRWLRCRA